MRRIIDRAFVLIIQLGLLVAVVGPSVGLKW